MALLHVVEFGGYASGRNFSVVPSMGPIQTQTITVGSTVSTFALSSATRLIFVDTDGGVFLNVTSSASTVSASGGSSGTVLTSTAGAAYRIPANIAPFPIYVNPYSRLVAVST
jgi:hypothetical protein